MLFISLCLSLFNSLRHAWATEPWHLIHLEARMTVGEKRGVSQRVQNKELSVEAKDGKDADSEEVEH